MMRVLLASLAKESLLIFRDGHALMILFVMPAVFVLIMSLALQERIHGETAAKMPGALYIKEQSSHAEAFQAGLHDSDFVAVSTDANTLFTVTVLDGFSDSIEREFTGDAVIELALSPLLGERERQLITAAVRDVYAQVSVLYTAQSMDEDAAYANRVMLKRGAIAVTGMAKNDSTGSKVANNTASREAANKAAPRPSATQQSVPAWLVFSMFFVSLPISTTLIAERQQKTLLRLRTHGVPGAALYLAKVLPYFPINLVQLLVVLGIGAVVVPKLGGEALQFSGVLPELLLITVALSVAVTGYGAIIATLSRTVEQATVLTGTLNIVLGALGGIMVPTFVMPPFMQSVARWSPMNWGLNGYLDALVYHRPLFSILPAIALLFALGGTLLVLAIVLYETRSEGDI